MSERNWILQTAKALGFTEVRFSAIGTTPRFEHYQRWLSEGKHADLHWMETRLDVREVPSTRLPNAKTVIALSYDYKHARPKAPDTHGAKVASYAWGRDYHNLVGKRLKRFQRMLRERGIGCWGGVDTAPILERPWAASAGLGFTGKNTLQIWPARGSWFFVAVVFIDAEIRPDPPLSDHCGRCRRCLDHCPTGAFDGPHQLDTRRCISYWTIEAKGLPPRDLRAKFGPWIFGCDACQTICPHNVSAPDCTEDDFAPKNAWLSPVALLEATDEALIERFTGSPLRRPGGAGLKRNALIWLGNNGTTDDEPTVRLGLAHPSPVVRGAAVWALATLGLPINHHDDDPIVQAELNAAVLGQPHV